MHTLYSELRFLYHKERNSLYFYITDKIVYTCITSHRR